MSELGIGPELLARFTHDGSLARRKVWLAMAKAGVSIPQISVVTGFYPLGNVSAAIAQRIKEEANESKA